ncbi:hypothetical protein J2P12_04445 [Candidatus Bathyarchaeota archaeon]|nr:hypothetical protein [Candidatus Bathyarchaeota archaeon]
MSTVEKAREGSSSLSSTIERAGTLLQSGAMDQIEGYRSGFETLEGMYERVFERFIKADFDPVSCRETAKRFFGEDRVSFAAVDGTDYARPLFDLVVFFGGSYAARGTITYRETGLPLVEYEDSFLKSGRALSSCVPVYVNEVPEIDQSFIQPGEVSEISLTRPLTDEAIANNSTVANWIMTFSEFYLAYRLAREENAPRILLLDRSLATMLASLIYDTSRRKLWKSNGALVGLEVDGLPIDINDLAYARHHLDNPALDLPTPRGDYLRYRLLIEIERSGPLTLAALCPKMGVSEADRQKRVERFLAKLVKEGFLDETIGTYTLKERYRRTWPRIRKLVETYGRIMFEEKPRQNPLQIVKKGELHWLTTQDLAFLTLFTLNLLVEECWKKRILLLGLTKDTAARDLKNHVLPVMVSNHLWKSALTQEQLSRIPNTDRMLLQTISVFNHESIPVPWSLIEYDSSFLMIVPDFEARKGYVGGAIRNKITPERLFLKSYIQLSQTSYDPQLRSNVLLLDRLVYPDFDLRPETVTKFVHSYGGADEPVRPIIFKDKSVKNPMQELVMLTLGSMTSNSIPELFGHNKPLFIADKVAKWHNEEMRRIIDTTGKWLMNSPKLRHFVFYMSTFRERRSEIEGARRDSF